jgi:hypothetical protein
MSVSIATNLLGQFWEQPARRIVVPSGQFTSMTCVYFGMESDFQNWAPRRGSSHPQFPSMYAQTINREDRGGGLIEVSIVYIGTVLQSRQWTDLLMQGELLQQSFSWSGPASWKGLVAIVTTDFQYSTWSVSFSYTSYQLLTGAIFESLASSFVFVIDVFSNISNQALQPGVVYTGFPTIPSPISPLLMLTRFTCQQQTPSRTTSSGTPDAVNTPGVWKCSETWQLAYNHGSLGFYEPNDVATHP